MARARNPVVTATSVASPYAGAAAQTGATSKRF